MGNSLSYVIVTPYTIAKSRTGGVLSRLLSQSDLELAGAQMIAPDEEFVNAYAANLRQENAANEVTLLADYVQQRIGPSGGRRHRSLLLLFRAEDACAKLVKICGHIHAQEVNVDALTGETIRDTYSDLIFKDDDPSRVTYFEPAVLTPRTQKDADEDFRIFAKFLKGQENLVRNLTYPAGANVENTLVIIKPDNWEHPSSKPGTIIDMFSRTGLRMIGIKVHRFSLAQALEFYGPVEGALNKRLAPMYGAKAKEILEKELDFTLDGEAAKTLVESVGFEYARDQFRRIVKYMSGTRPEECLPGDYDKPGGVMTLILYYEGENAIAKIRDVLGPTDPLKAPSGTVRREFGSNVMENTAHASDSPEAVEREQGIVRIHENYVEQVIHDHLAGND
jgi:nucleoside diphosphate kinase